MKSWIVRFGSLYVFNIVVLLLIGVLPSVRVGWAVLWAALVLALATIWLKPLITKLFTGSAAKSAGDRTKAGEKVVQYGIVFVVELIIWILVVLLSGVNVSGFFWGWALPPVFLLIAWIIYDQIDDKVETRAGALYDRATGGRAASVDAAAPASPAAQTGREELKDGLTPEQRKMLDDLG
ncbi:hypothetical protein [Microbacterium invictum]|uniref:Uncharacterized protein n=1 Tax=Microbacterium invictum TaxID=515415 RepID=A0AA40SP78_9MICO|nr:MULTISPECIES: hypothetical protein [Microbacterium]MBB4139865.1 hypothetical protein [Microbacterium invictum]